jgi:hypothetical protein
MHKRTTRSSHQQEEPRVSQQVFGPAKLRFVGKYALSRKHDERASASIEKKEKEIVGKISTQ